MAKTLKDKDTIFTKISMAVFKNQKVSIVLLVMLLLAGVLSYTTWLRREGFPSVQVPVSVGFGQYFVDDKETVDKEVTQKLYDVVLGVDGVSGVSTTADDNTFSVAADLEAGVSNVDGNARIKEAIDSSNVLPQEAAIQFIEIDAAKFIGEYTVILSLYSNDQGTDVAEVIDTANEITAEFEKQPLVQRAQAIDQFTVNPADESQKFQSSFGRVYDQDIDAFRPSVAIGIVGDESEDFDIFNLDTQLAETITIVNKNNPGYTVVQSVDQTVSVQNDINSLQTNVITGAIVVIIISALMISWRVSVLTGIFIVAVLVVTSLVLLLAGLTLNTITLFSLVLALGLFVDDATIIAESVYAKKDKKRKPHQVIRAAIQSIGKASFAGTLTTVLVFSPLLFITGILGEFIVQMPLTVIISLLVSFALSITMIPLLANYTILGDGVKKRKDNIIGTFLANRIKIGKSGYAWGAAMIALSIVMIMASGPIFGKLGVDIFPAGKDGNNLQVAISYETGVTLERAEEIADEVAQNTVEATKGNISRSVIFEPNGNNNALSGMSMEIDLIHYDDREITAPELAELAEEAIGSYENEARVTVGASGGGPPEPDFPFVMQVNAQDFNGAQAAAMEIQSFLENRESTLNSGDPVTTEKTAIGQTDTIVRVDNEREITVAARFNVDGSTEITDAAQEDVKAEFTDERLAEFGLTSEDIGFDLGQDSDFEESFNTLPMAALGALGVMFALLALQFRSVFKPGLILLALPFSVFGVGFGLLITDNSLSFFSMIGIIGLIGIAVNNTILLVDNATHHQKEGMGIADSMATALRERFRPLVTTTLTTVAALTPLALFDPFWQSLSVSIIFGLLSSTLLVVTAFPFYYIIGTKISDTIVGFVKNQFSKS